MTAESVWADTDLRRPLQSTNLAALPLPGIAAGFDDTIDSPSLWVDLLVQAAIGRRGTR